MYHPSIAVIVGMLSVRLSIVFPILAYAKFCHRSSYVHGSAQRHGHGPWGGGRINSSARFSGINQRAIELLPIFRFESVWGSKKGQECTVCIKKFKDPETLQLLPKRKHAFHAACIVKWLEIHSTCLLCQYRFDPKGAESSRFSTSMLNPSEGIGIGFLSSGRRITTRGTVGMMRSCHETREAGRCHPFTSFGTK